MTLPCKLTSGGFTYVSLMVLVAVICVASAATVTVGDLARRRAWPIC